MTVKINPQRLAALDLAARGPGAGGRVVLAHLAAALSGNGGLTQALAELERSPEQSDEAARLLAGAPTEKLKQVISESAAAGLSSVEALAQRLLQERAVSSFGGPASRTAETAGAPVPARAQGLGWNEAVDAGPLGPVRSNPELVRALQAGALAVDPARISGDLAVNTSADMSVRQLAAAAFNIPTSEVGLRHLQLLAQANPALLARFAAGDVEASVPSGTELSLAKAPIGLGLRLNQVQERLSAVEGVLAKAMAQNPSAEALLSQPQLMQLAHLRESLSSELAQLQAAYDGLSGVDAMARASARGATGVEGLDAHVGRMEASSSPAAQGQALALRVEQALSQLQGLEQSGAQALAKGDRKAGEEAFAQGQVMLDQLLQTPSLTAEQSVSLRQRKGALHIVEASALAQLGKLPQWKEGEDGKVPEKTKEALKSVQTGIDRAFDAAKAQFGEIVQLAQAQGAQNPKLREVAEGAKGFVGQVDVERQFVLSDLHGRTGRLDKQLETLGEAFGRAVGGEATLLEPDQTHDINSKGQERSNWKVWQRLFDKQVGFLSEEKLAGIAQQVKALPADRRQLALDALARLSEAANYSGDLTSMNVGRQVLEKLAGVLKAPEVSVQADLAAAQYRMNAGDLAGATEAFKDARVGASKLENRELAQALGGQAIMGEANAHMAIAQSEMGRDGLDIRDTKKASAKAIHELRQIAESKDSGLTKDARARLLMMEVDGWLKANESVAAKRALDHLKRDYAGDKELPWLKETLQHFESERKNSKPVSLLQVAMNEAVQETMGEAMWAGMGGAIGGALGAPFFGVGGIVGAAIGGSIGTLALKVRNLVRGRESIMQAGQTGLNSQDWAKSMVDGSYLALDAFFAAAPLFGAVAVGKEGSKQLTRVGFQSLRAQGDYLLTSEARELMKRGPRLSTLRQLFAPAKDPARWTPELTADLAMFNKWANEVFYNWKWALGTMGASIGATMGFEMLHAKNEASSMEERAKIEEKYMKQAEQAAQTMDPMFAPTGPDGTAGPQAQQEEALRAALSQHAPQNPQVRMLDDAKVQELLAARQAGMQEAPLPQPLAAQVAKRYDAYGKDGVAVFDPETGDVLANRDALAGPAAEGVMTRELTRQRLHSLPQEQFRAVVQELTRAPEWPALAQAYVAAHPEASAYTTPQLVEELLASALGGEAAGLGDALKAPALVDAGLDTAPRFDPAVA